MALEAIMGTTLVRFDPRSPGTMQVRTPTTSGDAFKVAGLFAFFGIVLRVIERRK